MISQNIKTLLEKSGKSVADLANYCGVSQQAAYQWISDEAEPRAKRKAAIASFFNIQTQELEYGPVLTLTPPKKANKISVTLDAAVSEHTATVMITKELRNLPPKSLEFQLGMRNHIIFRLSGVTVVSPFNAGTCQADAYDTGFTYGEALIDRLQISP